MKHLILFFIIIIGVLAIRLMTINTREDFFFSAKEEYIHPNASIKYSEVGGRGVFSNKNYHTGEIIEICPAIKTKEELIQDRARDYVFNLDKEHCLIGFGYCSLYNHSDNPNLMYSYIGEDKIQITAIKDIKAGDEMFVSYGKNYWTSRNHISKN